MIYIKRGILRITSFFYAILSKKSLPLYICLSKSSYNYAYFISFNHEKQSKNK